MLGSVVAALALAASVSQVAAGPVNHVARGYRQDTEILEDYTGYHVRYLALNCSGKHGTPFFEDCCHPLLRTQKLEERPAQCTPSASASSAAVIAEPTAKPVDEDPIYDDDEDCEDASSVYVAPAAKTPEPEPTTYAPEPTTYSPEPTKIVTSTIRSSSEAPQTTYYEAPTTTKSAAPSTTAPPDNGGEVFTGGSGTFYEQGGNAGSCGVRHSDSDLIVALDIRRYGDSSKQSKFCGKQVYITNTLTGKSVTATIQDVCPTCANENCLDLSHGTYDALGSSRDVGVIPLKWSFV